MSSRQDMHAKKWKKIPVHKIPAYNSVLKEWTIQNLKAMAESSRFGEKFYVWCTRFLIVNMLIVERRKCLATGTCMRYLTFETLTLKLHLRNFYLSGLHHKMETYARSILSNYIPTPSLTLYFKPLYKHLTLCTCVRTCKPVLRITVKIKGSPK